MDRQKNMSVCFTAPRYEASNVSHRSVVAQKNGIRDSPNNVYCVLLGLLLIKTAYYNSNHRTQSNTTTWISKKLIMFSFWWQKYINSITLYVYYIPVLDYITLRGVFVLLIYIHEGCRILKTHLNIMPSCTTPSLTLTSVLKHTIKLTKRWQASWK